MGRVVISKGLSEGQLEEISGLEKECCRFEKLSMKLNWDMLYYRPASESNDFLCYDDAKLVGYLGIYAFGPKPREIELTGMVHPDFRRKGIFKDLFEEAKCECEKRGAGRILIITERSSQPGIGFVKSVSAEYAFSEYRMKFSENAVPGFKSQGLTLRKANADDDKLINQLDVLCFGAQHESEDDKEVLKGDPYRSQFVIEFQGNPIGKIGSTLEGGSGYIFGFAIKPEYRGLGYGREALSLTLLKMLSEGISTVLLEVSVANENALSLYKSCGFKVDTIYDYYEIPLMR